MSSTLLRVQRRLVQAATLFIYYLRAVLIWSVAENIKDEAALVQNAAGQLSLETLEHAEIQCDVVQGYLLLPMRYYRRKKMKR